MSELSRWQGRNKQKDQIRNQVWQRLMDEDAVSDSPIGRIPAFSQAKDAASRLKALPLWAESQIIKCNPDRAQIPVRQLALTSGKILLMAVPQLKAKHCFVKLTQQIVKASGLSIEEAAIAKNALKVGHPIQFEHMPNIDLVIVGCVAVDREGGRTGKGAGFADLELGMLQQFGLINSQTPIITTVDARQLVEEKLPMEPHDWALDWIVTPNEAIATKTRHPKPTGIDWSSIQMDQRDNIPILKEIR